MSARGKTKTRNSVRRSRSEQHELSEPSPVTPCMGPDFLASIVDASDDAIIGSTLDGKIASWNRGAEAMFGYKAEEVIGQPLPILVPADNLEHFHQVQQRLSRGERLSTLEVPTVRKDGTRIESSITVSALCDATGQVAAVGAIVRDISARKRAEEALRQAEEKYRHMFEDAVVGIFQTTPEGRYLSMNRALAGMYGDESPEKRMAEVTDIGRQAYVDPGKREEFKRLMEERGEVHNFEYEVMRRDGSKIWFSENARAVRDKTGTIIYYEGTVEDITQRMRAEAALRASENKFRLLFERSADALLLLDPTSGSFVDCNAACAALLRCSDRQELLALHPAQISPPKQPDGRSSRGKADEMIATAMARGSHRFEWIHCSAHRPDFPVEVLLTPVEMGDRQLIVATCRDITDRKQAEEALRRSEADFRFLFANSPLPMWVFNTETLRLLEVNDAASALYGYSREEFLQMRVVDHLLPEDQAALREALAKRQGPFHAAGEWRHRTKNGNVIFVEIFVHALDWGGQPAEHVVAIVATARRQAEAALREAHGQLDATLRKTAQQARQAVELTELVDLLQSCQNVKEAHEVLQSILPTTLSCPAGALCLTNASRNVVEVTASWGESPATEKTFRPDQCWALRRGKPHQVADPASPLRCAHITEGLASSSLCVPLVAHGEALGVLYLESEFAPQSASISAETAAFSDHAAAVAERISMALANIRLREALRAQSIRDPLTGLFNRRYLEETLERELSRAARNEQPLSILMLDIDHFKKFNDTFGHQAGDKLLRAFGDFLSQRTRGQDLACRYGGEEFIIILAGAPFEASRKRAESLQEDLKHLMVEHAGSVLAKVTVSIGVSVYPDHGGTAEELLRAADAALYRAKAEGRDRIVMA